MKKKTPERFFAVRTSLGYLYGRDTVYLDSVQFQNGPTNLELRGGIWATHCTESVACAGNEIPYVLTFTGIMALSMVEEDSARWPLPENVQGYNVPCVPATFVEVKNSNWVDQLGGKLNAAEDRHFILHTYDETFEVICRRCSLELQKLDPSGPDLMDL